MKAQAKKRVSAFFVLLFVTLTVLFLECSVYFPPKIHVFSGETPDVRVGSAYTLELPVSSNLNVSGEYDAKVKLFGVIPVKSVSVDVLPETSLVPGGKTVGIKMFTRGLLCVGTEKLKGEDGKTVDAEELEIQSADIILRADGVLLHTVEQFGKIVEDSAGKELILTVVKNGKSYAKKITPVKTKDGYRLGIWVRDSTAGIGTITFSDKESGVFGALGHPITDVDTGVIMPVEKGSITGAEIVDVNKGERGEPGELRGLFDQSGTDHGVILQNTMQGIFGVVEEGYSVGANEAEIPVASKGYVKKGKAQIYANVSGEKVECFDVEITKLMPHAADGKNMVISVTDKRLLETTGGIVQGMSGSPIVQNGKLVGAVTHVFVNDPTRGYGIFIENMLVEAEKIK